MNQSQREREMAEIDFPPGVRQDVAEIIDMLERVRKHRPFQGWSEQTFCQKELGDRAFRERLDTGRITIRKLSSARKALQKLLLHGSA